MQQQYTYLLLPGALDNVSVLPQDVGKIKKKHLVEVGGGDQWLVVARWPCQDLSRAGKQAGLKGSRSKAFFPMLDVLKQLQLLQVEVPPGYICMDAS